MPGMLSPRMDLLRRITKTPPFALVIQNDETDQRQIQ